ncbi:MAG: hypothetical protein WA198_08495, partial [Candidatus Sulfotelmatobacter sp.]
LHRERLNGPTSEQVYVEFTLSLRTPLNQEADDSLDSAILRGRGLGARPLTTSLDLARVERHRGIGKLMVRSGHA